MLQDDLISFIRAEGATDFPQRCRPDLPIVMHFIDASFKIPPLCLPPLAGTLFPSYRVRHLFCRDNLNRNEVR
jgi:hypothetical protein